MCSPDLVVNFNDFFITALLIIPHGIFEFSSCILACAAGFVLFNFIYKFVKDLFKTKNQKLLTRFNISFNQNFDKLKEAVIILAISCILMVIAVIFEVYITIPFAEFVLSMLR